MTLAESNTAIQQFRTRILLMGLCLECFAATPTYFTATNGVNGPVVMTLYVSTVDNVFYQALLTYKESKCAFTNSFTICDYNLFVVIMNAFN